MLGLRQSPAVHHGLYGHRTSCIETETMLQALWWLIRGCLSKCLLDTSALFLITVSRHFQVYSVAILAICSCCLKYRNALRTLSAEYVLQRVLMSSTALELLSLSLVLIQKQPSVLSQTKYETEITSKKFTFVRYEPIHEQEVLGIVKCLLLSSVHSSKLLLVLASTAAYFCSFQTSTRDTLPFYRKEIKLVL
jgi:hypothetical protein